MIFGNLPLPSTVIGCINGHTNMCSYTHTHTHTYIYIYIYIYIYKHTYIHINIYHHHHHYVVPQAQISLILSRHFSLSFITSGRSSGLHPVSSHSCCMYILAGRPAFARPYVGVHRSTSLMSSFLLLQQCPACLVRLTCIVFVMGGRWPYSWSRVLGGVTATSVAAVVALEWLIVVSLKIIKCQNSSISNNSTDRT